LRKGSTGEDPVIVSEHRANPKLPHELQVEITAMLESVGARSRKWALAELAHWRTGASTPF
jgi:hypothetical protein